MFSAIDVETANEDLTSICQIGIATVQNGAVQDVWTTLVETSGSFTCRHIAIHGLDEKIVAEAPLFDEILDDLEGRLCVGPAIVVTHTAFDRISISRSCCKRTLNVRWLDSALIARRAWPERYSKKGYGLAAIARDLGIQFRHHDAGEDARVAAEIVLRASEKTGLNVEEWSIDSGEYGRRRLSNTYVPITRDGNEEGPLCGEVLVFTGSLQMVRRQAAELAAAAGCTVQSGVTKETTLLVVGDQDLHRLAGHERARSIARLKP